MNNLLIKICGISDLDIAQQSAQAGAHYIGIVFHHQSSRFVSIEKAKEISIIAHRFGAKPVAVFVEQSANKMLEICSITGINVVQLHGEISRSQHQLLPQHYIRIYAQSINNTGEIEKDTTSGLSHCDPSRDFLLFDNKTPGNGMAFDWQRFSYHGRFRWFLAGGLTAKNVATAISTLQPNALDISTGVENKFGRKEINLIEQFINSAKSKNNGRHENEQ